MTNLLKHVRHALETSTATTSGVEVTVSRNGALRVEPADVMKYPSAKDQFAAARKVVNKPVARKP